MRVIASSMRSFGFPPSGQGAGDVLVADLTQFLSGFGGVASLQRFWQNLAKW